jgi:undecaprenyl diphosphate synthase
MSAGIVTASAITQNLYDPTLPPVDVLVRTSGEARISNFLLWQITGARVFFTERTWPDFDKNQLDEAIALAVGHYA